MYVRECRNKQEFLDIVSKNTAAEVRVGERALALPVREQTGVVVRPALERHYVIEVRDDLQGETRVIFTEHLVVEHEGTFPFRDSLLNQLQGEGRKVVLAGRISGAA